MALLDRLLKRKSCCSSGALVPVEKPFAEDKMNESKSDKYCKTCC